MAKALLLYPFQWLLRCRLFDPFVLFVSGEVMGTLGLVPDAAWTLQLEHLILAVGRVSTTTDGSRLLLLHV